MAVIKGCTDPDYDEYNPNANLNDGSCATMSGCTDPAHWEYNPDATQDDGSWATASIAGCGESVTFDGHAYPTVQIGSYCWFAENLQSTHYNDEALIATGLDATAWSETTEGAHAVYAGDYAYITLLYYMWTSSFNGTDTTAGRAVQLFGEPFSTSSLDLNAGLSVRCVMD